MKDGRYMSAVEKRSKLNAAKDTAAVLKQIIGDETWKLMRETRKQEVVDIKHAMLHILKTYTGANDQQLHTVLGYPRPTVHMALERVQDRRKYVPGFAKTLEDLTNQFYKRIQNGR